MAHLPTQTMNPSTSSRWSALLCLVRLLRSLRSLPLTALLIASSPALWAQGAPAAAQAMASNDAPLFKAWGGKAGIRAVMDDFVPRLKRDTRIGHFFKDTNAKHLAEQLTDQLCVQAGGPCLYEGETMRRSHAELGISRADFNRLVELLQDSMDAHAIPFSAQNAMLARLAPMHRDIIDAPAIETPARP
jgi:hemoglobin